MPKYKVFLNDSLKWTGNAADKEAAIHAAAKKRGQIWNVRFDTPLEDQGGRVFLHTDKEVPDRITDVKTPKELTLVHDAFPRFTPGNTHLIMPLSELMKIRTPKGPVKIYGAAAV